MEHTHIRITVDVPKERYAEVIQSLHYDLNLKVERTEQIDYNLSKSLDRAVVDSLLASGKSIQAIRYVRERLGCSLSTAKRITDRHAHLHRQQHHLPY